MYLSLQFIILEILLGLVFLGVLYFMLRGLLKKILRKELATIKEPIEVLANYLVGKAQMEAAETAATEQVDNGQGQPVAGPAQPGQHAGQRRVNVEPSPEKLALEPVDVADEFVALKNANRINAYNLRVQKIWELYKSKKINIKQYNEELIRLKKEFGIDMDPESPDTDEMTDPALEKMAPVKKLQPHEPGGPDKEVIDQPENDQVDPAYQSDDETAPNDTDKSNQKKAVGKQDDPTTNG